MDIDDSEVIVITVLMFKAKDMVPFHKFNIDHILTKDTLHLNTFKKIVWTEGIETVRKQLGMMRSDIKVGYWRKEEKGRATDFKESFTNAQWQIALKRVQSDDKYGIVGKKSSELY